MALPPLDQDIAGLNRGRLVHLFKAMGLQHPLEKWFSAHLKVAGGFKG